MEEVRLVAAALHRGGKDALRTHIGSSRVQFSSAIGRTKPWRHQ